MSAVASGHYQQYAAPREPGTAIVHPCRSELLANLASPSFVGTDHGIEFCGKPLDWVRDEARREVIEHALKYTRAYLDVPDRNWNNSVLPQLILTGHQPEMFHCGVWFKNFLLSELSRESGAIGINFLVDNDLCRSTTIRVPSLRVPKERLTSSSPQGPSPHRRCELMVRNVPFDSPLAAIPWELRRLESHATWQNFPREVTKSLLPGLAPPLLLDIWPDAMEAVKRSDRPGLALAEMRHKLEQRSGLESLEVPLSHLVSTRAFARFSIQLLSELPRLQEIYNSRLADYRIAHRIRSHAHPVPELAQADGWLEAPWWVYRQEAPLRQPLWVRLLDDQLILSDRAGWQVTIEGRLDCDNASSQWLDLQSDGVCLRPRALLTTMYLRIMVSDLFIHGIGGGKYDQLTDGIVRDFFGIEPSAKAVATATLHLPLGDQWPAETGTELDTLDHLRSAERDKLWQLKFHAEQIAELTNAEQLQLVARKRELLANIPPRGEKWRWHREITAVNQRLSALAQPLTDQTRSELVRLAEQEREYRILQSRETSFCLFPLDSVTTQLKQLALV